MQFNEKLIMLRKQKGISQEELGNELNVSRQSVSKWELGQTKPDIDKIEKICEFYDISFDYLLKDTQEDENQEKNDIFNADKNSNLKRKICSGLKIIGIVLIVIYIANTIFKASLFLKILSKNNMNNINSYKYNAISQEDYVYPHKDDKVLSDVTVNKYICHKDDIYHVRIVYADDKEKCMYHEQYWDYYDGNFNKKGYQIDTKIKDGVWEQDYYYTDSGNFLRFYSTFKFVNEELKKEFSLVNIFNPFKFLKITEDGNLIIETDINEDYKYSKNVYYIDIKSGFLSKEEKILNDEVIEKTIYEGYIINDVEEKDLLFDENIKKEIIEKSKITMKNNQDKLEVDVNTEEK